MNDTYMEVGRCKGEARGWEGVGLGLKPEATIKAQKAALCVW